MAEGDNILVLANTYTYYGKEVNLGKIWYLNGIKLDTPIELTPEDFLELSKDIYYSTKVTRFIREKYSLDAELAIQRQRDTKPEAFKEYFDYCEECKNKAKFE